MKWQQKYKPPRFYSFNFGVLFSPNDRTQPLTEIPLARMREDVVEGVDMQAEFGPCSTGLFWEEKDKLKISAEDAIST